MERKIDDISSNLSFIAMLSPALEKATMT